MTTSAPVQILPVLENDILKKDTEERMVIVVRVNTRCNASCLYCGFSQQLNFPRKTISEQHLAQLLHSAKEFRHRTGREVLISWIGGEPFLWKSWYDLSKFAREECDLACSITTNGTLLENENVRQSAIDVFDELTISLDVTPTFHNATRLGAGRFQSLEATLRSIVQNRNRNKPKLRVNCVLTRHNVACFAAFLDRLESLGVDELTFNALGGNDRPEFFPDNRLEPDDIVALRRVVENWRSYLPQRSLHVCQSPEYWNRLHSTAANLPIPISDCHPGCRFLFLDEFGHVGPCSFTAKSLAISIDELASQPLEKWSDSIRSRLAVSPQKACEDCHATHVFEKFGPGVLRSK